MREQTTTQAPAVADRAIELQQEFDRLWPLLAQMDKMSKYDADDVLQGFLDTSVELAKLQANVAR
jgi:hypothetical protein